MGNSITRPIVVLERKVGLRATNIPGPESRVTTVISPDMYHALQALNHTKKRVSRGQREDQDFCSFS